MKESILIVEDQFVEADYLSMMLKRAGYRVVDIARSVNQARELISKYQPGFVLVDIQLKGTLTGIDLGRQLTLEGVPFIYISANSSQDVLDMAKATQPYGFIVKPFREQDLLVTLEIARYRHQHSIDSNMVKQNELLKQLQLIRTDNRDADQRLLKLAGSLQSFVPFDYMAITQTGNDVTDAVYKSALRIGLKEYQVVGHTELATITSHKIEVLRAGIAESQHPPGIRVYDGNDLTLLCATSTVMDAIVNRFALQSALVISEQSKNGNLSLMLFSKTLNSYGFSQAERCETIRAQLMDAVRKISVNTGNPALPGKPEPALLAQQPAERGGIIGNSHLLLTVLDHITQVADTDTSVLILGESGTGKESIANRIHQLSGRRHKPFVKINCAAMPATLIESELFGHEKGSFTGASERRVGKFEKAHGGTILLDEVAEMPLELQAKLLRVLQEQEIERVGGHEVVHIDVRIIAATNRNLEKEVAEGRFRLDLYYRLNVFPVTVPALRERKDDIALLADHFVLHFNQKSGRKLTGITKGVLARIMHYDWPGNIRELKHMIERAVLLAKGTVIEELSLPDAGAVEVPHQMDQRIKSIDENERDHILSVLKSCRGKVWGAGAAAEILKIHPSTLKSKMKKLGIRKEFMH